MTHPILDHPHPIEYSLKRKLWYCPTCGYEYPSYTAPSLRGSGGFTQKQLDEGCDRFHKER